MSSNPCNYMDYGGGDHKRKTRAAYGRSSYAKVRGRRLSSRPIGYSPALSVTYSPVAAAVAIMALYNLPFGLDHQCQCQCQFLWRIIAQ